jgi:hypothetical protein
VEVFGAIDIARDPWQFKHHTGQAGCFGGGEVRTKTVISKTEGK